MAKTKNLGQVRLFYEGSAPPANTKLLWLNTEDELMYQFKGGIWAKLSGGDASLSSDIVVKGVSVGNYSDGTLLPAGSSVTKLFTDMLIKQIAASYSQPNASLTSTVTGNVEVGTDITPQLNASFMRNDAGSLNRYLLRRGEEVLRDAATIATVEDAMRVPEGTVEWSAEFFYSQGAVKNDNMGNPSPAGRIAAGSITRTQSTTGRRNTFFGTQTGTDVVRTSAGLRSLVGKLLNAANGSQFTLNIPAGAKHVLFAYPDTLRDVTAVKYVEGANSEVKGIFTKFTGMVEGANAFTAIGYKIYVYTPTAPYSEAVTYNVTI